MRLFKTKLDPKVPAEQRITAAKHEQIALGIKIEGYSISADSLSVDVDGTQVSAESMWNGYVPYVVDDAHSCEVKVKADLSTSIADFSIRLDTADSTIVQNWGESTSQPQPPQLPPVYMHEDGYIEWTVSEAQAENLTLEDIVLSTGLRQGVCVVPDGLYVKNDSPETLTFAYRVSKDDNSGFDEVEISSGSQWFSGYSLVLTIADSQCVVTNLQAQ